MSRRSVRARGAHGFTLLELLVTMIIIAILAAIAIPVFFRQRDKGLVAQSQSALANAKLMAEAYYVGEGSFAGLNDDLGTPGTDEGVARLEEEGLRMAESVTLVIAASAADYCIQAINIGLPDGHEWKTGHVNRDGGTPLPGDCTP